MGALDWASNMFQGGLEQAGTGLINTFLGGIGERRRARINYEYGEKAAQNAFKRQMQLYQITKQDNSPEARRRQLEEAGMSTGLLYGNNGAAGGGMGSTAETPIGPTGTTPDATNANPFAFTMAKNQARLQEANTRLAEAQASEAESQAEINKVEAANRQNVIDIRNRLTAAQGNREEQEGRAKWLENMLTYYKNTMEYDKAEDYEAFDETYGHFFISGKSWIVKESQTNILKAIAETYEAEGKGMEARAAAKLQEENAKYVRDYLFIAMREVAVAERNAEANARNARTNAQNANTEQAYKRAMVKIEKMMADTQYKEFAQKYGLEEMTAKQWIELGTGAVGAIGSYF